MERRVLLAIVLSFLVLYLYQTLVLKPVQKPAGTPAPAAKVETAGSTAQPSPAARTSTGPRLIEPPAPAANALVGEKSEREIRVETRDIIAVLTNRGARVKSWRLKHYLDANHEPLELVVTDLAATEPLPFSLRLPDDGVTATLNTALYSSTAAPGAGSIGAPLDLRFEYRDTAGLRVAKTFHFDSVSYIVGISVNVTLGERPIPATIEWGPGVGDVGEVSRFTKRPEALLATNNKVQRLSPKDLAKQSVFEGDFQYAGVDDQYFMTTAIFTGPARVSYRPVAVPPPAGSKDAPHEFVAYAIDATSSGTQLRFFAGPKDFDVLASIDREFVRAIDFGMFAFLVVPLLRSLKWINGFVGNYGWSIIFLTVIINAIMFPLRHKSVVSMRKMQEIQPEVKAIQDRYAKYKTTDPARQKMNQELMALYKERGVNPASGCVPMLLTFPVLFAFYSLLSTAIELRGAPFFGWIHDLSVHDPLYITPVLMGLSQLWQTRITPAAGADPAQQKTMMMMPLVFAFMFLWAPAGVALYWLVSNLWGIGQQYLTNYLIGPAPVRPPPRPPAERRMKRVGGGKTEAAKGEAS
jgi:YidC/Oxa1 family membrane protein insertase